jgi:asparagine synthase (glutamine-hydrolysing)
MCGIAGIVHRDPNHPVDRQMLTTMLDAIRHRGPDDEGIYLNGNVGLGMRRLSIIDLEGGKQPIFNESRDRALVFNGEIYNYRELRHALAQKGHVFRTASDTETVVHLHEDHGNDCVSSLRGMFGFALWDETSQQLLLARDRFGIKPLYVTETSEGIAFASELKALKAAGFGGSELDWGALEGVFRTGYVSAPRSPFKNVEKLEPASILSWTASGGSQRHTYWDVPTTPAKSVRDPEELVRNKLDESVNAHLIADVPVAAFLSGGLDSSAVVSSMAMAGENVHAYTVRYSGTGADAADESGLAKLLANRYGVNLTVVDVEPDVNDMFESVVHTMDEPHGDESTIPTWLICEAVAREYKVAMVGTGGDELFGGYRRHFGLGAAKAWGQVPGPLRSGASRVIAALREPESGDLGIARLKRFVRSHGVSTAAIYLSLQDRLGGLQLFSPDVREELGTSFTAQQFERFGDLAPEDGLVRPALYLDYKTYLPDDILHVADRISMAHSLELRVPFVDHEIVEALFPMPDRTRVGPGRPKNILRRALKSRIPSEHFGAPKRGFVGPTALWLRNELSTLMNDELSADRLKRLGYFDETVVTRLRQEHLKGEQNHEGVLWGLLCFLAWHRVFQE